MFRPQEKYFTTPMLPRGSMLPLRTGRLSEQKGRAIRCWRLRGCGREELCGQSRHGAASRSASKKHRWLTRLNTHQRNRFCEQIRHGVLSDGRPLGQSNRQLFLPVFLPGTNRSNLARRCEAWQSRFARCDRKNSQTRAGPRTSGIVATNSPAQAAFEWKTLSAHGLESRRRPNPSEGLWGRVEWEASSSARTS